MPIAITSTSSWGTSRLRVALVLDNTGSMADAGKMTALKTALEGEDVEAVGDAAKAILGV